MRLANWLNFGNSVRILLGVTILYYVYELVGVNFQIAEAYASVGLYNIVFALILFFMSFFLKFQRLSVIIKALDDDVSVGSMRGLLTAHTNSSILSLVLPFKLGDVARVLFLRRCNQTYMGSLGIVAFERILDLAVVSILVLITGSMFSFLAILDGLMVSTRLAGVVSFFLLGYCGFKTIEFWHAILLKRSFLRFGRFMAVAEHIIFSTSILRQILKNQGFLLVIFTIVIWLLEALAFFSIYSYLDADASVIFFLGLISFIAFGLPAGPVGFGPVQLVFYFAFSTGLMAADASQDGVIYSLFVYVPALLVCGLLSFFIAKRWRVRL